MSEIITKVRSRNIKTILSAVVCQSSGGGSGAVDSFNGRTGVVVPQQSDYDSFFLTPAEGNAAYNPLLGFTPARRLLFIDNTPVTVTGVTSETLPISNSQFLIPANTIQASDIIVLRAFLTKSGTANTTNIRFRAGTLGTLSDAQIALVQGFATGLWIPIERNLIVSTSLGTQLIIGASLNTTSDNLSVQTAFNTLSLDFTQNIYISLTMQVLNAADSITKRSISIELIRP